MNELVKISNNQVTANSKMIADCFERPHKDVLATIRGLEIPEDFRERNFSPSKYQSENRNGQMLPCYEMTRDGFVLLAMGFTGKKAMEWKIKYIEAFNEMEKALSQPAPALDAKAIGGIVKKCASKAIKDELAVLPAPSFNPQALKTAIESEVTNFEHRRCIGMAVTPQEKQLIELIRQDYYIAVGKVYRAALDAVEQG